MLYIVIPVYNRINKTLQCIDSIKRSSIELDVRVVVDDGSTDNTGEILSKKYPALYFS